MDAKLRPTRGVAPTLANEASQSSPAKAETSLSHATLRDHNGTDAGVDFHEDPIEIDVTLTRDHVRITVEAMWDLGPPSQRRQAVLTLPREAFEAALRKGERLVKIAGSGTSNTKP